jgi:tripartite-type tricarboxylate transporter receptor subunit TctC
MLGLAAAAMLAGAGTEAQAEWKPRKPIELIIPAGAGGGADQMARLWQAMIQQQDLSPMPVIPINKAGGSGGEALLYMKQKAGDDHTIMITLNSYYTTPLIQGDLDIDITQFTPIKLMALDTFLLWVPADSQLSSLDDYVATVKEKGKDWKMGGTGSGQEDSILTAMLEAEFGLDMTYIPFEGGGTVAKNLVGKHIDSTVNNPSEQQEFMRAGQSKPLVQFTPERMEAFADVPTAKELGHDLVYFMQRSVNGPPQMSAEAQQWYIDLFTKVFESKEWQDYCASEGLVCDATVAARQGEALAEFHVEQVDRHKKLIEKVGAAAITGE